MKALRKLKLIAERAKRDKKVTFTSLVHLINEESLAAHATGSLRKIRPVALME
jgi:hypothetical protein